MISDEILFYIGIFVTGLLIAGFFFTAYEFNQLDENDGKHYRHQDSTSIKFENKDE